MRTGRPRAAASAWTGALRGSVLRFKNPRQCPTPPLLVARPARLVARWAEWCEPPQSEECASAHVHARDQVHARSVRWHQCPRCRCCRPPPKGGMAHPDDATANISGKRIGRPGGCRHGGRRVPKRQPGTSGPAAALPGAPAIAALTAAGVPSISRARGSTWPPWFPPQRLQAR